MNKKVSIFIIEFVFTFLVLTGINWGLPSKKIKRMFFSDNRQLNQILEEVKKINIRKSWEISKEGGKKLPRSYFNLIRTFHPDEEIIIKSLSNMNPENFDFNPHYFVYPAFFIYIVGGVLFFLNFLKIVKIVPDITFYFLNPDEMAKLYLTGRFITLISALIIIFLVFKIGEKFKNKSGLFSSFLVAFFPLFFINSHYMTLDIPMILFSIFSFFFALKYVEEDKGKYLYLSSIFAGFSGGVKYPGIFIWGIVPISLFMKKKWDFFKSKTIYLSLLLTIASFFMVNPYIIIDYPEFRRDFLSLMSDRSFTLNFIYTFKDFLFNMFVALKNGGGFVLIFLCFISFVYSLFKIKREKIIFLSLSGFFLTLFPTFLAGGVKYARYYLPCFLFLLLISSNLLKEISKIKRFKIGIILVSIFLLSPFLKTIAYANLFHQKDVRVISGEYINENFKKDTTFAFLKYPWIFEVPPVDNLKFKIKVVEGDFDKIKKGEYLIIGELEYFLTIGSRKEEMEKIKTEMGKYGLQLFKIFKCEPEISGISYYEDIVIHDILYPQPVIMIFEKK